MGFFEDNFGEGSKKDPTQIKWEYITVTVTSLDGMGTKYECDRLGRKGWEMCAYSEATRTAMFKRPKYDNDDYKM